MIRNLFERLGLEKYLSSNYLPSWLIMSADLVISIFTTLFTYSLVSGLYPDSFFWGRYAILLIIISALCSFVAFTLFRTYRAIIRHSTLREIWKLAAAALSKSILLYAVIQILPASFPNSETCMIYVIFDGLLTFFLLLSFRIVMIFVYERLKRIWGHHDHCMRVLIYDTGDKETAAMMRLQNSPHYRIIGFLTYGIQLRKCTIAEKPVYYFENENSIKYLIDKLDLDGILFATEVTAQSERERLIKYCTQAKLKVLILPPVDEVIDGKLMKQSVREIRIENLLGRPEIKISLDEIKANFRDKTVLVTGAAGSIGSELCRQLATFGIERLILFDNAETPMHNLRLELQARYPHLNFVPVIGDVRVKARLDMVFRIYHPDAVFHAAAYKHVPLMEENPCEAILVNVAGSRNVADFCLKYGVRKMVMISTDKAVNPTNIMGASKRLAEIYVQSLGEAVSSGRIEGHTKFVTTRFGNVLGSNGSVIPLFRDQIAKGGPVTVTHPDITRFFMTIPEACRLVMEAAAISSGNEIFVFDMGESVKIADLAKRMIELAGSHVGPDGIEIAYTGLRPGEKLYEELLSNEENTKPTTHEKIRIAQVRKYKYEDAQSVVGQLELLAKEVDIPATVKLMKETVPEFISQNSKFEAYDHPDEKSA